MDEGAGEELRPRGALPRAWLPRHGPLGDGPLQGDAQGGSVRGQAGQVGPGGASPTLPRPLPTSSDSPVPPRLVAKA